MITHDTPDSSNIRRLEYDDQKGALTIHFRSGSSYQYDNVSPDTWSDFISAPSAGRFFNQQIKGKYKEAKL